ncbi:MAG: hypothetical protein WCG95_05060 [bacterium]
MKKAQSVLEFALLLCIIVPISFAVFTIYNNQKIKLADMTKSSVKYQSVNLISPSLNPAILNDVVPYSKTETAGSNALTYVGKSASEVESALSSLTYSDLSAAVNASDTENIFTLANSLISMLHLKYDRVSENDVNRDTLSILIGVLNASASAVASKNTDESVKAIANNYIDHFHSLLD